MPRTPRLCTGKGEIKIYNKKRRRWLAIIGKRSLASLIALCMLFSFAPTVIAEGTELIEEVITNIIPETPEEVTLLSEITEMRDEFSKTFLMSHGTYTQVSYASPVHFEDENGVFQEIDNRLSVNAMTGKVTTGNGGTDVAFSQSQPQVSIDANGHSISWSVNKKETLQNNDNVSLMNISPSYAPFTANAVNVADTQDFKALPAEEQLMSAHKAFSEMKYASLLEGYAVNYTVAPGRVKEDILITSAENNEFVITVNAMGLTAVLGDYRTVIFKNNANETVLTFDVPYMYDANDEFSTDIDITLTPILGGYEITLTADEEWLESEDRVYPVVIDPVYTVSGASNVVDTYAHYMGTPGDCGCGVNHAFSPDLQIGQAGGVTSYGLIKFNTITGYGLSKITGATIKLTASGSNLSYSETLSLQRVKSQEWNTEFSYDGVNSLNCASSNKVLSVTANTGGSYTITFDIRQDVIGILVGEYANHGYRISYSGGFIQIASSESTTSASRPVMTIDYEMDTPAGTYFFNNVSEYEFLAGVHYNSYAYTGKYDVASNADNENLLWEITNIAYYSGYSYICTARDEEDGNQYALYSDSTSHARVGVLDTQDDKFKWNIIEYAEGEYIIVNKADNTNLLIYNGELYSAFDSVSDTAHWRMMTQSEYNPRTYITEYVHNLTVGDTFNYDDIPREDGTFADDDNSYTTSVYTGGAVSFGNESLTVTGYGAAKMVFRYKDTTASITVYILSNEFPGTYFIKNVGSGMYMDLAVTSSGNFVKQYGLDGDASQKWQFEIQTDGSYMIRNVEVGTYLTIAGFSVSGNNPAILDEWSLDDDSSQRFDIEKDSNGTVTIYPQHGEASNAILGAQTTYSDAYIGEGSATADDRDKWVIFEPIYSIVNYYDDSFLYFDDFSLYITNANEFVEDVFREYFYSALTMDGSASEFDDVINDCPNGTDNNCSVTGENACSNSCNQHHKNISRISDVLYEAEREDNHIYVLWTNIPYNACCIDNTNGDHCPLSGNALGLVLDHRPVIQIFNIPYWFLYQDNLEAYLALTLLHEIAHTFGMPEIYEQDIGHQSNGINCVMATRDVYSDEWYNEVRKSGGNPFCQSCYQKMKQLLKNIEGN